MKKLLALLICAVLSLNALSATPSCLEALKVLFAQEVDKKEAGEFLKLQSDITLHRLAWTYLKAQEQSQDNKIKSVEKTIVELLNQKYTNNNEDFRKARDAYESQPLSRSMLAEIAPYLKDIMAKEFGEESKLFQLNSSDLKLLAVLAKREKAMSKDGQYDHRMFGEHGPNSVLNFVKMINNDYGVKNKNSKNDLKIEMKLAGLDQTMSHLQKKMNKFFDTMNLPAECQDDGICDPTDPLISDLFTKDQDIQNVLWETIRSKLPSDDDLFKDLEYGDLWLKVRHRNPQAKKTPIPKDVKKATAPDKIKFTDTKEEKKSEVSPERKVGEKRQILKTSHGVYVSDVGVMIHDPLSIIKREQSLENVEVIASKDLEFQQKMASAIMGQDTIFEYAGKLYWRKNGKEVAADEALKTLPPVKQQLSRSYITSKNPAFVNEQVKSIMNGDETFIYDGELYNIFGRKESPVSIVMTEMNRKGMNVVDSDLAFMDSESLVIRANAIKNNHPYYKIGQNVFDTMTGNNPATPFRSPSSDDKIKISQNVKVEKQRREAYQYLSDEEIVLNFHRDYPQSPTCGYYAVVNKKTANIKVYSHKGLEVFSTEVLVGAKISDQKTRFLKNGDLDKMASGTTGAGIYSIGELKTGHDYYKKNYNDNLFSVLDHKNKEMVFALHQVPNGLRGRYARFGTNNPDDRRASGGCVNLKEDDFKKIQQWLGPTCQIYVLPEEEGNHFVLKNGQINLYSEKPVAARDLALYSFNSSKKAQPIEIKITENAGDTPESQAFVKALTDEKPTLMKVLNIDNDDYNDLALLSYAIMGNESDFGKSKKYTIKENNQGLVTGLKYAREFKKKWEENLIDPKKAVIEALISVDKNNSRGFTQIKYLSEGEWRKAYPNVNEETLGDPKNSAIATVAYLADALHRLKRIGELNKSDPNKPQITRENRVEYLAYLYLGRTKDLVSATNPATPGENKYVQKLKHHMTYLEISQKIE